MKLLGDKCITAAQAKKILDKKKKTSLTYEQKIALDFLNKSVGLNMTDAKKFFDELSDFKMKDNVKAMIINNTPKNKEDLALIFAKERVTIKDGEEDKILSIVKKYCK